MRIIACGSRDYTNVDLIREQLAALHKEEPITCLIEGRARGADTLARIWAQDNDVPVQSFPADWNQYGRAAGPIRNQQMLDEGKPDLVIAFFKTTYEESKGTKDMVDRARKAGVPVTLFEG